MSDGRKLFERQLAKAARKDDQIDMDVLASLVIHAYEDFERDRTRTDRAIVLMAEENDVLAEELHTLVKQLEVQNGRFEAALENMPHGLSLFDESDRIVVSNRRLREIYGFDSSSLSVGTPLTSVFEARFAAYLIETVKNSEWQRRANARLRDCSWSLADGSVIDIAIARLKGGGWVALHNDVTEQRRAEARIAHIASHDALTGLANRLLFRTELECHIGRLRAGEKLAILYLDLDHFKAVNDTLGHPIGDQLLQSVSEVLKNNVGHDDLVARLGGDEFAIIQASSDQPAQSTALAHRILEQLSHHLIVDGQQVSAATSIGIAVAPCDGNDPDLLLKNADMALYKAKADGRCVCRFFEPEMDARLRARREIELDLRSAIGEGQLELLYQPVLDIARDQVTCVEALLRWNHPSRGRVSPAEFIGVAEETGLIDQIGEWVLRRACADAKNWPPTIKVAVNVSPVQFRKRGLPLAVAAALAQSGLSPSRLEIEITEAVLLQNTPQTLETLHHIKRLGVSVAMDDFGTGYSSLCYLRSFPFDKIKIDQSFVRDIDSNPDALAIIQAITGLGQSLGIQITVEGVETHEQLKAVRDQGCNQIQGFLISKPREASVIKNLIEGLQSQATRIPLSLPTALLSEAASG